MPTSKSTWLLGLAVLIVLGLGAGMLIWPAYCEDHALRLRIAELRAKAANLESANQVVEQLTDQLERLEHQVTHELREVPESPDVAGLIRKLSLPVDKRTVSDQQFLAGQPAAAITGDAGGLQAMPVMVEMTATFEAVVALLQSVEAMDRLVRVVSVRVGCKRPADFGEDVKQVTASLGLEAIYEAPIGGEVK